MGEYVLPSGHADPVILDIGALGIWASGRRPGCFLHRDEPLSSHLEMAWRNPAHLEDQSVSLHPIAIGDPAGTRLLPDLNHCGPASARADPG